jgi:hypothetical protein
MHANSMPNKSTDSFGDSGLVVPARPTGPAQAGRVVLVTGRPPHRVAIRRARSRGEQAGERAWRPSASAATRAASAEDRDHRTAPFATRF